MRRLFIIRKDLNLKPGKLAAMVGHCCEAYWTNLLKNAEHEYSKTSGEIHENYDNIRFEVKVPREIWNEYVNGIFTKTICECKNLNQLGKVEDLINEYNNGLGDSGDGRLVPGVDWGFINDRCLTDLTPENPDGTTTIGIWFRPLPDEVAHFFSRKFKLYGAFDK